jgi:hypothetical protein
MSQFVLCLLLLQMFGFDLKFYLMLEIILMKFQK